MFFKKLMSSTVVMRIGKKSKEGESRSQVVDGINRLICTSKSQSHPLTGFSLYSSNLFKHQERPTEVDFTRVIQNVLVVAHFFVSISIVLSSEQFLEY